MTAYAVAHMRRVTMCPAIVEYLERVDATVAPLRTGNSDSDVILADGVGRDHRATDVLMARG